jgi:predicted DsbA family dithiol-disulfide isomerase
VNNDIYEAQQVGARGVPFFVFDNRYTVSGARSIQLFLDVLHKVSIKE